ncbi:MAG: DUF2256 domain-containing protein [Ferruginibacter sp.]
MKKPFTKKNLPEKTCVVCMRPFSWRKKWEKIWDEVKYCSDKCRMNKKSTSHANT